MLFLFYWGGSYIVKRFSAVWSIRAGVLLSVCAISLVCVFNDQIVDLYLLFAGLIGASSGFFWIAFNGFSAYAMSGERMHAYQTYKNISWSVASVIFPFTLGSIIHWVSFYISALVVLAIGIVLVGFTLMMNGRSMPKSRMSMTAYAKIVKSARLTRPALHNFAFQYVGTIFTSCGLFATILIAIHFGNSFSLGSIVSIFAVVSITILTIYRFIKSMRAKTIVFAVTVALAILLTLPLCFEINRVTIILLQTAMSLFVGASVELGRLQCDTMRILGKPSVTTENLIFCELAYFLGRFSILGLILFGWYMGGVHMFAYVILGGISTSIIGFWLWRGFWKKYGSLDTNKG